MRGGPFDFCVGTPLELVVRRFCNNKNYYSVNAAIPGMAN